MALLTPDAPPGPDSEIDGGVIKDARKRQRRQLLAWILPLAAVIAGTLVLWGSGSGTGGRGSHALRLDASFISAVERATAAKPGTIVVHAFRECCDISQAGKQTPATFRQVLETRAGNGSQDYLNSASTPAAGNPGSIGVVNGVETIYIRKRNAIYRTSIWRRRISEGKLPGAFVYTPPPKETWATPFPLSTVDGMYPAKSLNLTATQAHALLDGTDTLEPGSHLSGNGATRLTRAYRLQSPVLQLWRFLKSHQARLIGLTTVDGHRAIELVGPRYRVSRKPYRQLSPFAGLKFWINARTYAPIKEVVDGADGPSSPTTWSEYRTLPITVANQRLLNPAALHPRATLDLNYRHLVNSAYSWFDPYAYP